MEQLPFSRSTEQPLSPPITSPLIIIQASLVVQMEAQTVPGVVRSGARFTHFTVFVSKVISTEQVLNLHMLPLNGGRCRGRKTQCSGDDRMWPDNVGKTTAISTAAVPRTTEKWACLPHRVRVIMFQRGHIAEIQSFAAVV